jgi:elongation factor P
VEYHSGSGQFGGSVYIKGKNLRNGHVKEWRARPEEKWKEVELTRKEMEYLYSEGESLYFMDPETYDQVSLPKIVIGEKERFLKPNMRIPVELHEGTPVYLVFPEVVDLRVVSAPPGVKEGQGSTYKTVILENGMEILAPQFIKEGDLVRVEVETGKYRERVKEEGKKK